MTKPAIFDSIAFQYDENRGGEERGHRFAASFAPLLDRNERVLEIGVGTGVVASALEAQGFNIIGVDVSREMLKRALNRVRQVVWTDMNALPFVENSFGSVYAVWALHLARNIPEMLHEIRRILITGGAFLNCSAANRNLVPINDRAEEIMLGVHAALAGEELTVDSPKQLEGYADAAGFSFERVVDIPHDYETTPAKIALHLERRGMSVLQRATPEQVRDIIEPALAELKALPEQVLHRRRIHQITVLRAV